MIAILHFFLALFVSPLLFGIINKIKALFAGRKGPPILQLYYTLFKLWQKSRVYSKTTTSIFQFAPFVSLTCVICATLIVPFAGQKALLSFSGDLILFIYLLAFSRFSIILSALDTGSSFEGMGASREVSFSIFTEITLLLSFTVCAIKAQTLSLSGIYTYFSLQMLHPTLLLIGLALIIVLLTESCRIPIDDPNTHLELTMIHEVMVLDHSSTELGIIFYTAYLKLWLFISLVTGLFLPTLSFFLKEFYSLGAIVLLTSIIGIIESVMARFRFIKIFDFILTGLALAFFAFVLQVVGIL